MVFKDKKEEEEQKLSSSFMVPLEPEPSPVPSNFMALDEYSFIDRTLRENSTLYPMQAPDPVGMGSALIHGASFGYLGEEPNTGWGTAAELLGILGTTVLVTKGVGALTGGAATSTGVGMRALEAGKKASLVDEMILEGVRSIPADAAFLASPMAEDMEDPEKLLPVLTGVNMLTVPLTRLLSLSKARLTVPKIEGSTGRTIHEVLDDATRQVVDEGEGVSFAEMLSQEPRAQSVVRGTTLEKDIVRYNQLADEYIGLETAAKAEWDEVTRKAFFEEVPTGGESLKVGIRESDKLAEEFLTQRVGGQLSQADQKVVMDALGARVKQKLYPLSAFNTKAYNMWRRGEVDLASSTSWNPKFLKNEVDLFVRQLDDIEDAVEVGLAPTATYKEVLKKTEEIARAANKEYDRIFKNPKFKKLLDETVETATRIFENRELGVSPEFAGASAEANELLKMSAANALFSKADSRLLLKADEMERLIKNLEANQSRFTKLLEDTNIKASKRDFNTKLQSEKIQQIVTGAKELDPREYAKMRVPLGRYILSRIQELLPPVTIDEDIGKKLTAVREEIAKLGETKLKDDPTGAQQIIAAKKVEESQLKTQLAQSYFSNPTVARAIAQQTGDETLVKAIDYYYASLGDLASQGYLAGRKILGQSRIASDIRLNRLMNNPGPTIDSTVDKLGKPTGKRTLVEEGAKDLDPADFDSLSQQAQEQIIGGGKDIGMWRRLTATPEVIARLYGEAVTSPALKTLYGRFEQFFVKAWARYNKNIEDIEFFETNLLKPFEAHIASMGEHGSKVIDLINDVDRLATRLIKEGIDDEEIRLIINKKVAAAGDDITEGYRLYREMDSWNRTHPNEAIRRVNRMIDNGELKGVDRLDEIPDRPGHSPFEYEGDYNLFIVDESGEHFVGPVFGRAQAVKEIENQFSKNPDLKGRFVLYPKVIDDAGDLIRLGTLGKDMERTFGVDATHLKKLRDSGEFTEDTLHDVFYGGMKERVLGLENAKIDVIRATALRAMAASRYANYIDLTLEGRQLAKAAKDYSLPRWGNYISTYSNDLLGISRGLEKTIDDHLSSFLEFVVEKIPQTRDLMAMLGLTPGSRAVKSIANMLTFIGRMGALGYNIGTAFINMMIIPTNVLPVTSMSDILWGMRNYRKAWNNPEMKALFRKGGVGVRQSGVLFTQEIAKPDILKTWGAKAYEKFDNLGMWMFNRTEDLARGTTILAARRQAGRLAAKLAKGAEPKTWQERVLRDIARGKGMKVTSKEVLDEYSLHIMRNTNFDYSVTGLSELARNPVAKPFMQFKTFLTKEVEFLMGQSVPLTHKERFMALGAFGTIGGLFAIPGVEDIDVASRWLFGASPKLWMDTYMPEVLTAGVGAVAGIDLSNRMSLGSVSQLTDIHPFGLGSAKLMRAINNLRTGNMSTEDAIIYQMSALHSAKQGLDLLRHGEIRDTYGQKVVDAKDVNPLAMLGRMAGFQTTQEAQVSRARTGIESGKARAEAKDKRAIREILQAERDGNTKLARHIQEKAGVTDKQLRDARKRWNKSADQLITEKMKLEDRETPYYRDVRENLEQ